jgi:release factor glutamine methyltransferase
LLQAVCGIETAEVVAHPERIVTPGERARFQAFVERRAAGEPVAYIVGRAGFYGREFLVDRRVLIPRPETEHVVEAALQFARTLPGTRPSVADVGTGSGAIAITLAAEDGTLEVVASDISADALAVARANAQALGVAGRVRLVCGDLLAPLGAFAPYDIVVANLPYVPTGSLPVAPHPVGYEPRVALDGGADGLALYRRLLADLDTVLKPRGGVFLEAAPGTIEVLAQLARDSFPDAAIEIGVDYAGLERYLAIVC